LKHQSTVNVPGSRESVLHNEATRYSALLVGATGLIGSALLRQLIRDPLVSKVTVITRRPMENKDLGSASEKSKLIVMVASFDDLDKSLEQVDADVVFCTLGTTIKVAKTREAFRKVDYEYPLALARFAERTNASVFSVVTAMGASSNSKIFYSRVKGELQDAIARLSIPTVQVFQPSLLLGERNQVRPGESFGALISKGLQFAMVGPMRKYRPIKGEDVALAMSRAASQAIQMNTASKSTMMHYYPSDKIADLALHTMG
jgi:uncharacterized protein YbjT (DUF2867 family)